MADPAFNPAALPFKEAIDYWQKKLKLPASGWTDIWQEQHSLAFVVTGASQDALLEDFYNALSEARVKGGYEAFKSQFEAIAKKHGWSYNGAPGWRSRVIYDTNVRQSYNAGRYQQMNAVKRLRPYWRYRHSGSEHPRLEHQAWDGLILPADDPWWDTHAPQNGWGCGCEVESLSRVEAEREWKRNGKDGPDSPPPMEWREVTVGKNGGAPRTVRVPEGIDPGFAYSPGKAYLEPHTVPPLTGYDAVLQERAATWPSDLGESLPVSAPSRLPASIVQPADVSPVTAVTDYLDIFGATMEQGVAFTDAAGSTLAISKALFVQGDNKTGNTFKWLENPGKTERLRYINLLAMTLIEPDEIWWNWERTRDNPDKWMLRRRYLRAFEIEHSDGKKESQYGIAVFTWGKDGWTGSTTFLPTRKTPEGRTTYFKKQRAGRLLFKK
ncbi:MAG: hypothetical protein LBJ59_03245 [Zoogloeaceae bacterium]|jgi:hypothetical protein|nr:hypothetical protein [Zoogloeaceae bacterium]